MTEQFVHQPGHAERFVRETFPQRYKSGALTRDRYSSPDFAAREFDRVFARTWLVVGRTGEIPESGDYFTHEIGRESVLVVRQDDGSIRAFHNVCQHRGNRLVHQTEGSQPSFTCDYHSWRWGIDGMLQWVQDEGDFSQGSPCGRLRLAELRCEVLKSFIFVNMDSHAVTLREYLGPVWDQWQVYPIEQMVRVQALTVSMPCNWKGLVDNFSEVYHFATVHRPFLDYLEDDFRDIDCDVFDEGHTRLRMKAALPSLRHLESGKPPIGPQLADELERWGLDPADFAGKPRETRLALQEAKRRLGPGRGHAHYAAMTDSQLTDSHHYVIFPNFAIGMLADGALFHRLRPHADDPNRSYYDVHYYAFGHDAFSSISTASGSGEAPQDVPVEYVEFGERSLGVLLDGDVNTMKGQQLGWRSRGYRGGELSDQEFRLAFFHHMLDRYMAGELPMGR
ncbi:MAG TPA: aromatic ring-hydroxylating dioxygenase subunit alpha [Stellaceae bacterium]|nr:aromatic ring-hydroxylating dioxygenase subunit alpha [Stellaceae bacterium]